MPRSLLAVLVAVAGCSSATPTPTPPPPVTTIAPPPAATAPATTVGPITAAPTTSSSTTTTTTTSTTLPPPPLSHLDWELIAEGFVRPNYVLAQPGTETLLVMLASGEVWPVTDGVVGEAPYLDLSDVVNDTGIEQGLLGMAFHPADPTRLFAYFSGPDLDARLVEVIAGPVAADAGSAVTLLVVEQPANRHQAGMLQFGPDGYLYISSGDGGDGGTQGQNPESMLGTILRIDVDSAVPYAIPADNPFAGGGGAPEVIAYGLRNPWRFSIDPVTEVLYIGDVGQDSWEEINVIPLDLQPYNFGWPLTEGAHCFLERGCDPAQFEGPTLEFSHDEGCSVTAGFVYRGRAIPELTGSFFYSDWCGQWVRSFVFVDGQATDLAEWSELDGFGQINSFGIDSQGELLVTTWAGDVARIVPVRDGA